MIILEEAERPFRFIAAFLKFSLTLTRFSDRHSAPWACGEMPFPTRLDADAMIQRMKTPMEHARQTEDLPIADANLTRQPVGTNRTIPGV